LFFFRDLLNISTLFRSAFTDEKRRFETRINQLEEELEEEQTNAELSDEKLKKISINYEQALLDISIERSANEKLEVYLIKKQNIIIFFLFFLYRLFVLILNVK